MIAHTLWLKVGETSGGGGGVDNVYLSLYNPVPFPFPHVFLVSSVQHCAAVLCSIHRAHLIRCFLQWAE